MNKFSGYNKIHCIGIGGIGVSALAQYYLKEDCQVSGSDLAGSEITQALKELGIKIFIGPHSAKNLPANVDLVVYSPAVQPGNPELKRAKKLGITSLSYPEALGELTKKYFTIAVSGTHGKSTTAAMTALILIKAGLDPTVIIGTKLKEFKGSNFRIGKREFLVIEADEWRASFLNYFPKIIVLTNIEREHLDYYKNLNSILKTYKKYIKHLPRDGVLVANSEDKNIKKITGTIKKTRNGPASIFYSLGQKEAKKLRKILRIPGAHNVYNALAALMVARVLKIPDKISFRALSEYRGSWRRFEERKLRIVENEHSVRSITVINDYAHHPTEVKVTLKAAREKFPKKTIWCVFQPHQYQRTYYLFNDFVKVFQEASIDKALITDIYDVAGREEGKIKKNVSSEKLAKAIRKENIIYLSKEKIINYLKENLKGEEIVIIMGAGDIYKII